ncbi:hypothetical protein ATN84_24755 [Paramesorhizobium deserti]|uniref:Uncharacterized protein n=1 Tax=Paramesorhizobium deserti TaxID=1494590 RepID=A0A135HXK7_9HYPH|nr:hypothetical protein [Paramesorhizobium deserti]KXF77929.1 hypothetical protein ATN84_24755 [Paramesorhizobium deserti]
MPIFKLATQQLCLMPVGARELLPTQQTTQHPARTGGLPQHHMRTGFASAHPNEGLLFCRLKSWLRSNEALIIEMLEQSGHSAFAVEMNYALANSNADCVVLPCNISILGTAATLDEVSSIFPAGTPYGFKPRLASSSLPELRYTYFVGQRV